MSSETIVVNAGANRHIASVSAVQTTGTTAAAANAASSICLWKIALFLLLLFIIIVIIVAAWRWWGSCNSAQYARARTEQVKNYQPLEQKHAFWTDDDE